MSRLERRATAIGGLAILLWSMLAVLTVVARGIPPLELMAASFTVATVAGQVIRCCARPSRSRARLTLGAVATTFCGLFFYHALYFYALAHAPADRASLINYLWPLLIVVFSAALPGANGLQRRHFVGAVLGLVGTCLVMLNHASEARGSIAGYGAAFLCAVVWAGYSVINRRHAGTGSAVVLDICGAVALAAFIAHFMLEARTVMPDLHQSVAILALGLGPTGLAFVAWDYATKHGSLPVLGALSYLAPLLSTVLLVLTGEIQGSMSLLAAALLIMVGAIVATGMAWRPGYPPE